MISAPILSTLGPGLEVVDSRSDYELETVKAKLVASFPMIKSSEVSINRCDYKGLSALVDASAIWFRKLKEFKDGFDLFNENWDRIFVAHNECKNSVLGHPHEYVLRTFDFEGNEVLRITNRHHMKKAKISEVFNQNEKLGSVIFEGSHRYILTSAEKKITLELKGYFPKENNCSSVLKNCFCSKTPEGFVIFLFEEKDPIGHVCRRCTENISSSIELPDEDYYLFGAIFDPKLRVDVKAVLLEAVFLIVLVEKC